MYKLLWACISCCASALIAGYLSIVIPIITKDSAPAMLGGNFSIWAICGWIFMSIIMLAALLSMRIDYKRRAFLRCILPAILFCCIPMYQYFAARDTARVNELFTKKINISSKTKIEDKIQSAFDRAHKKSEKNIKILIIILLSSCIGGIYLIAREEPHLSINDNNDRDDA